MSKKKKHLTRNIRYCVHSAMNQLRMNDNKEYEWFEIIAREYFSEVLSVSHMPSIEVAYLDLSQSRSAKLPVDYIRYSKVGLKNGNRIWTLTRDNSLNRNLIPQICGEKTYMEDSSNSGTYVASHDYLGTYHEALFMEGGGINKNYYTIDEKNRRIVLDAAIDGETLILEYLSSGKDVNSQTVVPTAFVPVIRKHLMATWEESLGSAENKIARLKNERDQALYDARIAMNTPSIEEVLDVIYETSSQATR